MDTVKLDKRGKILIPLTKRKSYGFFTGEKFIISVSDGRIILTPYCYQCCECGEEIKDGSISHYCEKCQIKYRTHVY